VFATSSPHLDRPARSRITIGLATLLILALSSCTTSPSRDSRNSRSRTEGRPNVLIIITDDQRSGTLAVMPRTRAIFGRGGTQFTNAFATTPQCCPSRASIFSGRYAHNHGVLKNLGLSRRLEQATTLQAYLHDAGYTTAFFGKYLNGWNPRTSPPFFDTWTSFIRGERYYRGHWNVNGELKTVGTYSTTHVERMALRFLQRVESDDDRPWLMFVAPTAPHLPIDIEPQHSEATVGSWGFTPAIKERDRSDKPGYVRTHSTTPFKSRKIRRKQLRALMSVDDMVDSVFGQLDELEEGDDTVAVFMSDNGLLWGDHGLRHKSVPYRFAVQIPFLLRWPGRVDAGIKDERLVANIDVAPTVLDAAGEVPDTMDGMSLLDRDADRDRLLIEYWKQSPDPAPTWAGTLTSSYQYVEYFTDSDKRPDEREYYDLAHDPWQLRNLLADEHAGNDPEVGPLSAQLARDRACTGSSCP
jgi:arylsulfatase A-like enzyme